MGVPITGTLSTTAPGDSYPTHDDVLGKIYFRVVDNLADWNTVPLARRYGLGYVKFRDTGQWYEIQTDLITLNTVASPGAAAITLTGDVVGSGSGTIPTNLSNTGVTGANYGTATQTPTLTVDAKGRITAAVNTPIQIPESAVTNLTTDLALKEDAADKGIANGYASLDAGGLVPLAQMPFAASAYLGLYNATTNTPAILNGVGVAGQFYIANVIGNAYAPVNVTIVNQVVVYDGAVWQVGGVFGAGVVSVNALTGAVSLTTNTVPDFAGKRYVVEAVKDALAATQAGAFPAATANPIATNDFVNNAVASIVVGATQLTPEIFEDGVNSTGDGTYRLLNTLTDPNTGLAYTTPSALIAFPLVTGINATTFTYDDACEQQALYTMIQNGGSAFMTYSGGKQYVHGVGRFLPSTQSATASYSNRSLQFEIDGRCTSHRNGSGTPMVHYSKIPADQTEAINDSIFYAIKMRNLTIHGITGDTGIEMGASYQPRFEGIKITNTSYGIKAYFCLHGIVDQCDFEDCDTTGLLVATGFGTGAGVRWTGASLTNSASNGFGVVNGTKFRVAPGAFSGVSVYGCDGFSIVGTEEPIEGSDTGTNPTHHIYINGQGSTLVKRCKISQIHFEQRVTRSYINIEMQGQIISAYIDNVGAFSDVVKPLIETTGSGVIQIFASFTPDNSQGWTMQKTAGSTGNHFFFFDAFKLNDQNTLDDPSNWTGTPPASNFLQILRKTY